MTPTGSVCARDIPGDGRNSITTGGGEDSGGEENSGEAHRDTGNPSETRLGDDGGGDAADRVRVPKECACCESAYCVEISSSGIVPPEGE